MKVARLRSARADADRIRDTVSDNSAVMARVCRIRGYWVFKVQLEAKFTGDQVDEVCGLRTPHGDARAQAARHKSTPTSAAEGPPSCERKADLVSSERGNNARIAEP